MEGFKIRKDFSEYIYIYIYDEKWYSEHGDPC